MHMWIDNTTAFVFNLYRNLDAEFVCRPGRITCDAGSDSEEAESSTSGSVLDIRNLGLVYHHRCCSSFTTSDLGSRVSGAAVAR